MDTDYSIQRLVGETLYDVCFVMDYLQLGFNGSTLNCYSCPRAHTAEGVTVFPEKGSRDALCSFIGHDVVAVEVVEDVHLVLCFDIGRIDISIGQSSGISPEAAEFISRDNRPTIVF